MRQGIIIITVLILLLITPFYNVANATNYEREFKLVNYPGGTVQYSLTVSITSSLYNYYVDRNHDLYNSTDFAKFITPYSVKPIADALRNFYSNDEVFADAVLGITQQIPYLDSPEVYPVETLKLNSGDCGSFSLLVASILKAGGLDVVLLEYTSLQHLNVGVYLPNKPIYVRSNLYWIDYNSKRYYIAESTGGSFPNGWRVGECPSQDLRQTSPNVITVENSEQQQPGQVAASYKTLNPSQISISTSTSFAMENSIITIAGMVSPANAGNISIYVSTFVGVWQVLTTVSVGSDGKYVYQWRPQVGGMYNLLASWSGNQNYAGADSAAVTLYIVPFYGLIAGVLGFLLLVLIVIFRLMNRRGTPSPPPSESLQKTEPPPSPPPTQPSAEPLPQTIEEPQKPPEETQPSPQPEQSQTPEGTTQTQETQPPAEETTPPTEQLPQPQTEQPSQPITEEPTPQPTEETTPSSPPAEETSPPQPAPQPTPEPQQTEPTPQPPTQPAPAPPSEEQPQPETPAPQEQTPENPPT